MDFVGKICPYCKTELKAEDEIVVCSVCEMPHHKECWIENKACTTFGCTGTIVGGNQYAEAMSNNKFCSNCGTAIAEGYKFCSNCGTSVERNSEPHFRVSADNHQPNYSQNVNNNYQSNYGQSVNSYQPNYGQNTNNYQQTSNNYGYNPNQTYQQYNNNFGQSVQYDEDFFTFVAANQSFYANKFQQMQALNSKTSWNWCSFLFGACWFAYRKMYGIAAIYAVIATVLSKIGYLGALLQLALWICAGLFANYFYKQHVEEELRNIKMMDQNNKSYYIAKKGGTSVGAIFALFGIMFVISLIFSI